MKNQISNNGVRTKKYDIYLEYIHESIRIGSTNRSKVVITVIDAIVVVTESGDT